MTAPWSSPPPAPDPRPLPPRPTGLRAAGRRLWDAIAGSFELRPDELRLLEDAAREADVIERMRKVVDKADAEVAGSMGQPTAHPLLAELRQHRALLTTILTKLKLPDDPEGYDAASDMGRRAARARWGDR